MRNLETVGAVHTHTHTHTCISNEIESKIRKMKSMKLFSNVLFCVQKSMKSMMLPSSFSS